MLVVNTKPGISTTDQHTEGFANAAKAGPRFSYVGVQYDNDTASLAAQITLAALQKNSKHRRHLRDQPGGDLQDQLHLIPRGSGELPSARP